MMKSAPVEPSLDSHFRECFQPQHLDSRLRYEKYENKQIRVEEDQSKSLHQRIINSKQKKAPAQMLAKTKDFPPEAFMVPNNFQGGYYGVHPEQQQQQQQQNFQQHIPGFYQGIPPQQQHHPQQRGPPPPTPQQQQQQLHRQLIPPQIPTNQQQQPTPQIQGQQQLQQHLQPPHDRLQHNITQLSQQQQHNVKMQPTPLMDNTAAAVQQQTKESLIGPPPDVKPKISGKRSPSPTKLESASKKTNYGIEDVPGEDLEEIFTNYNYIIEQGLQEGDLSFLQAGEEWSEKGMEEDQKPPPPQPPPPVSQNGTEMKAPTQPSPLSKVPPPNITISPTTTSGPSEASVSTAAPVPPQQQQQAPPIMATTIAHTVPTTAQGSPRLAPPPPYTQNTPLTGARGGLPMTGGQPPPGLLMMTNGGQQLIQQQKQSGASYHMSVAGLKNSGVPASQFPNLQPASPHLQMSQTGSKMSTSCADTSTMLSRPQVPNVTVTPGGYGPPNSIGTNGIGGFRGGQAPPPVTSAVPEEKVNSKLILNKKLKEHARQSEKRQKLAEAEFARTQAHTALSRAGQFEGGGGPGGAPPSVQAGQYMGHYGGGAAGGPGGGEGNPQQQQQQFTAQQQQAIQQRNYFLLQQQQMQMFYQMQQQRHPTPNANDPHVMQMWAARAGQPMTPQQQHHLLQQQQQQQYYQAQQLQALQQQQMFQQQQQAQKTKTEGHTTKGEPVFPGQMGHDPMGRPNNVCAPPPVSNGRYIMPAQQQQQQQQQQQGVPPSYHPHMYQQHQMQLTAQQQAQQHHHHHHQQQLMAAAAAAAAVSSQHHIPGIMTSSQQHGIMTSSSSSHHHSAAAQHQMPALSIPNLNETAEKESPRPDKQSDLDILDSNFSSEEMDRIFEMDSFYKE